MINDIQTIDAIQQLAVQGFRDWKQYGEVNVQAEDDLLIFNYSTAAQYAGRWNFFEQVSRGLIINCKTGEIVARPFDKFFNWLEGGRRSGGHIVSVTEKIDGSLGVLYRTPAGYRIATRGSFIGFQSEWATRFLSDHYDLAELPDTLTLLFEIICPDNRVVVNYGDREDLILLAARNRHTGEYLPFFPDVYSLGQRYGFALPRVYAFNNLSQIIAETGHLPPDQEGYVVEFSDGQRFKFKGDRYLELQKLIVGLTYKNVLRAMSNNSIQHIRETVPEEFLDEVNEWMAEIQATLDDTKREVQTAFDQAPKHSRRDFAVWVNEQHPELSQYLFGLWEHWDIEPLIYKTMIAQASERNPTNQVE